MFKTLRDFDVAGKRVLVRCDFNVPLDEKGNILDDFRIKRTLPTIKYLIDQKAKNGNGANSANGENKSKPDFVRGVMGGRGKFL